MKTQNSIYAALPVLFGFFVMGFCDIVGIFVRLCSTYFQLVSCDDGICSFISIYLVPVLGIPIGNQMNKWGRKNTVLLSMGDNGSGYVITIDRL